jgi:hypothetical protein
VPTDAQKRIADAAELAVLRAVVRDLMRDQTQYLRVLNVTLALAEAEVFAREMSDDKIIKASAVIWRTAFALCKDAIEQSKQTQLIHDNPSLEGIK